MMRSVRSFITWIALVPLLTPVVNPFGVIRQPTFRIAVSSFQRKAAAQSPRSQQTVVLQAAPVSLKPAALPLMDAGKALARSGEILIDITTALDLYGGALSAAGAQIRNAGDSIAQAAASCRFKTGTELVTDELREAATCLKEGAVKLTLAINEALTDEDEALAKRIEPMVTHVSTCSVALESAGAALMQRQSLSIVGKYLVTAGQELAELSQLMGALSSSSSSSSVSGITDGAKAAQRCMYASEQMVLAGSSLLPVDENRAKPVGKSWLKGG